MKFLMKIIGLAMLVGCSQQTNQVKGSFPEDSIVKHTAPAKPYKPGLGELMSAIQMHHGKLWFAGINNNWKLAEYETGEIKEILTSAEEIETDRPEVKDIHTVYPSLDSVTISIAQQNLPLFKSRFGKLTESCNNCHNNHRFEFNRIIIPQSPPVTNQDFKPH